MAYFNERFLENLSMCTNVHHLRKTGSVLNTNSQELRKLYDIFAIIDCSPYPRIHMYWCSRMRLEIFTNKKPRDHFLQLRNNMHVVDSNESTVRITNPLWKVQPILEAVNKGSRAIERVPGFYSINKQMIPFTGRCKLQVLVKNKLLVLKNYVPSDAMVQC